MGVHFRHSNTSEPSVYGLRASFFEDSSEFRASCALFFMLRDALLGPANIWWLSSVSRNDSTSPELCTRIRFFPSSKRPPNSGNEERSFALCLLRRHKKQIPFIHSTACISFWNWIKILLLLIFHPHSFGLLTLRLMTQSHGATATQRTAGHASHFRLLGVVYCITMRARVPHECVCRCYSTSETAVGNGYNFGFISSPNRAASIAIWTLPF